MNRDDIIRMAREAGFDKNSLGWTFTNGALGESLEALAYSAFAAGVLAEREECAKVVDDHVETSGQDGTYLGPRRGGNLIGLKYAAAIRARGQG